MHWCVFGDVIYVKKLNSIGLQSITAMKQSNDIITDLRILLLSKYTVYIGIK